MAKLAPGVGPDHPQVVHLFGATGALTKRKLIPGLFHLISAGFIPDCKVVGVSLDALSDEEFHLDLKHQLAVSWMVSSVDMGRDMEPWGWVYSQPPLHVYPEDKQRPQHLPRVIHYCQRYFMGLTFSPNTRFRRYPTIQKNYPSCEHPLYEEPPPEVVYSNKSQTLDHFKAQFRPKETPLCCAAPFREWRFTTNNSIAIRKVNSISGRRFDTSFTARETNSKQTQAIMNDWSEIPEQACVVNYLVSAIRSTARTVN